MVLIQGKKPLTLAIPKIENESGKRYLRINLVHNRTLKILYGKTEKVLLFPADFSWETIYLPYDHNADQLIIRSNSSDSAMLIREISLVETR